MLVFIIVITLMAIVSLIVLFYVCRKLCHDAPSHQPHGDLRGPAPPPLAPLPALPALPEGIEPPPYSEVTAKPFLYLPPQGPCPECGRGPGVQPPQTSFWGSSP